MRMPAVLTWIVVALAFAGPAAALNPVVALRDYHHTVWTTKDGAPSDISGMAQTADGWLWLVAHGAVYRFDGLHFERYNLPRQNEVGRSRVRTLIGMPDGDLLISYEVGTVVALLHPDGRLDDIIGSAARLGAVDTIAVEPGRGLWLGTSQGLALVADGKYRILGRADGLPEGWVWNVLLDQRGQLWVQHIEGIFLRRSGSARFERYGDVTKRGSMIQSADGRVWLAGWSREQDLLRLLSPAAGPTGSRAAGFNAAMSRLGGQFDRDDNYWTMNCAQPPCRLAGAGKSGEPLPQWQPATSGPDIRGNVLEDAQGSIWIASPSGLERYRENKLTPFRLPARSNELSLVTDDAGSAWAADAGSFIAWQLSPAAAPVPDRTQPFRIVANDRDGGLLLAGRREIVRRYRGHEEKIPLPPRADGQAGDLNVLGLQDDGRVLWMYAPEVGLMGYLDGRWLPHTHFKMPTNIMLTTPAGGGRLWLACADLTVVLYDNGTFTSYDAPMIGIATSLHYGPEMIAAGERGMAVLKGRQFRQLTAADADVLRSVSGLTASADGDRWINGGKGVVHVRRADWEASIGNPDIALRYELIGETDGYTGAPELDNRLHTAVTDAQGTLWFVTTEGIVHLVAGHAGRRAAPPGVSLTGLNTADARYLPVAGLRLPAGLRTMNIQYAAPGALKPEGVRFQYRLAGEDSAWQDAGDRRAAYYTNMTPGRHRFEVRAVNDDGVWSAAPAALDFDIAPTLVQTIGFRAACALAVLAALYLFYRRRLHVATARMEERMQVRLAERERIARTLHDSFLQSVQGLVLTLDQAVHALPSDSAMHKTLAPILHGARATINQGRDQVYELRSAQIDDVESALYELTRLMAIKYPGVVFRLVVDGARQPLRARVADEAVEIAAEAVRNAYQHAAAGQVMARIGYGSEQFTLSVKDDGVGMTDTVTGGAEADRHWGLRGMRERAVRIGAALDVGSHAGQGTTVTLILSARLAYGVERRSWLRRLLRPALPN
ncbi:sensor histidine kinase [Duganella hordei]|uniref:sensor histidine kinase n=1 Tax=Duganella hordei TaxID=2865934 RepID=UPI0030EA51B4